MFVLVWLASAILIVSPFAEAQSAAAAANELTGSWLFNLSQTVLPPAGQFLALGTFTGDGSFIGTAQGDGATQPSGPTENQRTVAGQAPIILK